MRLLFSQTLFTCFIMASYFTVRTFYTKDLKYLENRLFAVLCLASAVWGLGFFEVNVQTEVDKAYFWRAIGMGGTFAYLIIVQMLVCQLSGVKSPILKGMEAFSFFAIPIYFFVIQKEQAQYELTNIGMTYSFTQGFWNNAYTAYTVVLGINILWVIWQMIRHGKERRIRELGKKFLVAEIIIMLGALLDTVFPLLGRTAIPGSTIGQFAALIVLYDAVNFINRFRLTITNMSEFIYYSLAMPVLVYSGDYKLQILNDAAFSFFGIKEGKVENVEISQLFNIRKEDVFSFEQKRRDVDAVCCRNQLYCSLAINKIYDDYGDNIGYIIIVTDLSERMRAIQRLEEAKKEAEYANQAKSTFLANMSHEIRTPMNAIIGFSEVVLKMDISDEVRGHVEDIKWSSHNLLAIINDILDISKIESGKMELLPENYYVGTLFKDVSLIISSQAQEKGLDFHMTVDPQIPNCMYGDVIRLRGILINILNNAVKYTQEGSVSFDVSILERTEEAVKLEFKVSDTGIGIRPEEQNNLFKSFEQLDRKVHYGVEGSGLGLAIANGYVNLMGGEIQVSSVYGEGSVFTVILEQKIIDGSPMDKEYSHEEEKRSESTPGDMQISDVQVLVVDDNFVNLRVADCIMKAYGLIVDTASSGKEAVELCKTKQYQFVFMDQMMPEMNGAEAMEQIRAISPYYAKGGESKIIVLTADAISGARKVLIEQGFDEYLGKPINLKRMEWLFVKFLPGEKIKIQQQEKLGDGAKAELDYLQNALPEIDVAKGVKNCGGEYSDYLKILKIAWDYGEKQLEELENLQKQQDYENYTIKIHAMKSTVMNMGAVELSKQAKEQEIAGKRGDYAYIDEHMEPFVCQYRALLKEIEKVLRNYEMIEETSVADEVLEEKMIFPILQNIEQCIDNFEFPKVFEILDEIKKCRMPEKYQKVFEEINEKMDELAVDEIKELLEKTLEGEP